MSKRDLEKKEMCLHKGITLIEVPFWWNGSKESLIRMIQKQAPQFVFEKSVFERKALTYTVFSETETELSAEQS